MFIGHYGASFAAKAVDRRIPLWVLFIAAQLVDIFWNFFILLGIERVRVVPGITAANPLDFVFFPFTHSLVAAVVWGVLATLVYRAVRPGAESWKPGLIVGLVVLSHWVLDLLVHRPDLPLYDDAMKVGLGLWNYPPIELALECLLLIGGIFLYWRATQPVTASGKYAMFIYGVVVCLLFVLSSMGPPPPTTGDTSPVAIVGLVLSATLTAFVFWLEKKRA
jgi:hypothetical protein